MANKIPNNPGDRRDPLRKGGSISGSTKRGNDATENALHPQGERAQHQQKNEHTGMSESGVIARSPDREIVDQEPGESQKRNQGDEKDDPLAA
jgi:hypothetical protein